MQKYTTYLTWLLELLNIGFEYRDKEREFHRRGWLLKASSEQFVGLNLDDYVSMHQLTDSGPNHSTVPTLLICLLKYRWQPSALLEPWYESTFKELAILIRTRGIYLWFGTCRSIFNKYLAWVDTLNLRLKRFGAGIIIHSQKANVLRIWR